jgi:hypothetical protein
MEKQQYEIPADPVTDEKMHTKFNCQGRKSLTRIVWCDSKTDSHQPH